MWYQAYFIFILFQWPKGLVWIMSGCKFFQCSSSAHHDAYFHDFELLTQSFTNMGIKTNEPLKTQWRLRILWRNQSLKIKWFLCLVFFKHARFPTSPSSKAKTDGCCSRIGWYFLKAGQPCLMGWGFVGKLYGSPLRLASSFARVSDNSQSCWRGRVCTENRWGKNTPACPGVSHRNAANF